jgi:predicted RNase H-like HicB family nuclease
MLINSQGKTEEIASSNAKEGLGWVTWSEY